MAVDELTARRADEEGVPVEDLDPEDVAAEVPPMQVPIEGFHEAISTVPGGARPDTASIALRGGKLPVEGEFKKGDVIELFVKARVAEIHFVDVVDVHGNVTATERRHVAKPIGVKRLAASEVEE